jgi:hypothetical protein
LAGGDGAQQGRGGEGVDQPGGDGDVADPEGFQVQRRWLAVDADVGDPPAGADQFGALLEGLWDADRLDGHVGAEPVGEPLDHPRSLLGRDRGGGAEGGGPLPARLDRVDGHDLGGGVELGAEDGGQADRPGADDGDGVAGLDVAVEDSDLVAGRQDVGQIDGLLVGELVGELVGGGVGEGDPGVLGLDAVDAVAEDPAAAAQALAGVAGAAEAAAPAGGDARQPDAVAFADGADAGPVSRMVPTASWPRIRPGVTSGTSPLRMCRSVPQMVTVSMRTMASVSSISLGSATSSQRLSPGPWYTTARMARLLHGMPLVCPGKPDVSRFRDPGTHGPVMPGSLASCDGAGRPPDRSRDECPSLRGPLAGGRAVAAG